MRALLIATVLVVGCSNSDFDVAPATDAESETSAPSDTAVTIDSGVPLDDVVVAESCVANACGGCTNLGKPPMTACGMCNTSQYECEGTDATKCALSDDRTDGNVDYFKSYDGNGITFGGVERVAVAFILRRDASVTSVKLAVQRYDVDLGKEVGNLQVRLIKGTPTLTPASSDVLATSLIAATIIPDTPSTYTVTTSGVPTLPAGTRLYVELTDVSPLSNFGVNGAPATSPNDVAFHYTSSGVYKLDTRLKPYLVVGVRGCL